MTDIAESTEQYEAWLKARLTVIETDLAIKRQRMSQDAFAFLRGSFYRWAELFPKLCADLAAAPHLLGVGDLHIDNFGTWRDTEGRLAWGVNDFDEATTLPYTNDLVRLGTSVIVAIQTSHLSIRPLTACNAVLEGYGQSLKQHGSPIVLAERHRWLRNLATDRLKKEREYWQKLSALPSIRKGLRPAIREMLENSLPVRDGAFRVVHRRGGLGSLGRQRFLALAPWHGALIAREAKALTTSAWHWRKATGSAKRLDYHSIICRAVRSPDPFLVVRDGWVIRRLAPDCRRIDLTSLAEKRNQRKMLWMMGWETGNVHLGTHRQRNAILADLRRRPADWLLRAAKVMCAATMQDWRQWREAR